MQKLLTLIWVFLLLVVSVPGYGQGELPRAPIVNDEGGPVVVRGEGTYTFPAFRTFFYEPFVILRDATFIVDRNFDYVNDQLSQVFGKVTSNAFQPPFTYQLLLPQQPIGLLRDVDHDAETDVGVMVFVVQLAQNMLDDPYQQERDFITGFLQSVKLSEEPELELEIESGKLLIYAPDDEQGFPSGFGEDGLVFTDDDPIVILPQGYTVVDFSTDPFVFDRSEQITMDLVEPDQTQAKDFSDMSYTEAFDAMIDLFKVEYAFTEQKGLDWDEIRDGIRPLVEDAEADNDPIAFQRAIRDFAWMIPDGHINAPTNTSDFLEATEGGLGIALVELDNGRIIVNFVLDDTPASDVGIELGAEVLEINGLLINEAVEATVAWSGPFSTHDFKRLQQLRYVLRYPMDQRDVELVYQNPGDDEVTRVVLELVLERVSFDFSSFNAGLEGTELPVEFRIMNNGYGYIKIHSFADDLPLTLRLWDRAIATMIANEIRGIIIDMRQNTGGTAYLSDQMAAYFFNEELNLGFNAIYNEGLDDFYYNPDIPSEFVLPPEFLQYQGSVAVLIHPLCSSACESFAYNLTLEDRAAIVGHYTTAGLGGSVVPIFLPDGVRTSITNGRGLNSDGEVHLEGVGVAPTIRVPVTEETVFSEIDPLMDAAITYLDGSTNIPLTQSGDVEIGDRITDTIMVGERKQYRLQIPDEDTVLDFIVESDDSLLDTYLRLYVEGSSESAVENDDDDQGRGLVFTSAIRNIAVPGGLTIIVEVGTYDDAEAGDYTLTIREAELATIFVMARADPDFSIFLDAIVATDLVELVNRVSPLTIFIPNNDAFETAMEALNLTQSELFEDQNLLRNILLYHIVPQDVRRKNILEMDGEALPTLLGGQGLDLTVTAAEDIFLNDEVGMVGMDIIASNGIIHIIDEVLLPPLGLNSESR